MIDRFANPTLHQIPEKINNNPLRIRIQAINRFDELLA